MKTTNLILAIFLVAISTQAQIKAKIDTENGIASIEEIPHPEIPAATEDKAEKENSLFKELYVNEYLTPSEKKSDLIFFCYPSLFTTELFVTTNLVELSEIQLVNDIGEVVFKEKTEGIMENQKLDLPAVLPAGVYYLKIKDGKGNAIRLMKK